MIFRFLALVILPALALTPARAAEAARRVALVIGNSRYEPAVGALRNPVNDARAMAKTLRALGFAVIEEQNVTRDELIAAMLKFRQKLRGAEVGLFYFSGHGISVSGANYLLPVKSGYNPEHAEGTALKLLAETKLFNAEQAVAEMSNIHPGCNLVILDACRSTPVGRNPLNREVAAGRGLVEMSPPAGSLIAFSTDAGHVASDGSGANGVYTAELIKNLAMPGLSIEQVFKRTRAGVIAATSGEQMPAEYSRLVGEDIFLAGNEATAPAIVPEAVVPKAESLPTRAAINRLAAAGDAELCVQGLRQHARAGSSLDAAVPMGMLLEQVKEALRDPKVAAAKAELTLRSCDLLLAAIPECIPGSNPQQGTLSAKAHSRRGDALLLLGRAEEALEAFDKAIVLTPEDGYVRYNRGMALLRLERREEAKAELASVADVKTKQPGARKLAAKALAEMK